MVERLKNVVGYLYEWLVTRHRMPVSKQVQVDLMRLNPSADKVKIYRAYFVDKLMRSFLIGMIAIILGVVLKIQAYQNRFLGDVPSIERNSYAEEDKEVGLIAYIGDIEQRLVIQVATEQLTEAEVQSLYEEFVEKLPNLIIGENSSLQEVSQNLLLEDSYEGYPFSLEWRSDRGEVVTRNGTVYPLEAMTEIILSASISYGEYVWNEQIEVTVMSPTQTQEEKRYEELLGMVESSEEMSREEKVWQLPLSWKGQDISWELQAEDYSLLVIVAGVVVILLIFFCSDMDLHKEVEKRCIQMRQDYPDVVYKILLYMGAGMTTRGTFCRIAEEYEEKRSYAPKAVYEEILYTVHELESGVSEGTAYMNLGMRTGAQEYIRLGTLLTQNLKRGNATLLLRLREEVDRASVERMQNCKKHAEEAVTKLLVPMVMMLAIVMVMIMMPAFTSIN